MEPGGRFVFRLALALGMSLAEVRSLSGPELDEWKAYHAVEPLPDPHWDAAQICSIVATMLAAKGKRYKVSDFLPRMDPTPRRRHQTPEEMYQVMRRISGNMNGSS